MTRVHELPLGTEFRANATWYKLIKLGMGSATVDKIGSAKEHVIRDEEGNELKHFTGHDKRITIGLTTEVDETRESTGGRSSGGARQSHDRMTVGLQPAGKSRTSPTHPPGHRAPCHTCGKMVSTHRRGFCVQHYKEFMTQLKERA